MSALRSLHVLHTPPEAHFDAVCRTAQTLFGVPIALVSLTEEDRQWFKARCGLDADGAPREIAFCAHAILSDEVLVVEDAAEDTRFRSNPLVTGAPGIRFYAGAPLIVQPGIRVGTLCVMDTAPRDLTAAQLRQLQDLAEIVVAHLRLSQAEARARAEAEHRLQQEAALVEARQLAERASEAKGELLATLAHEVRTPLTGLLGYADLLLHAASLGAQARRYAEHVHMAGSALLRVVDGTLEFSAIEAGQITLGQQPFSPAALVTEASAVVEVTAAGKGLRLVTEVDPALPARLVGDPDRLRQVLLNLLTNALKFTSQGSVTLSATCQGGAGGRCQVRFQVADTGIGIAEAGRASLFERFSQADGSVRRTYGGTGLGLAISKRLVEAMGGEIGLETEMGQGSTFWVTLDLPEAEPLLIPPASAEGAAAEIVIEDGPALRAAVV